MSYSTTEYLKGLIKSAQSGIEFHERQMVEAKRKIDQHLRDIEQYEADIARLTDKP